MQLAFSPAGRLRRLASDAPLAAKASSELEAAFARGPGEGLLHLGTVMLAARLPASLGFGRALAKAYLNQWTDDLAARVAELVPKGMAAPRSGKPSGRPSRRR